jgi:hypothetical protein
MSHAQDVSGAHMIREHQQVVLAASVPEFGLETGDIGVVVHRHYVGKAFEVEFLTLDGEAAAVATLAANQIRVARQDEIWHARFRVPHGRRKDSP